MSRIERPVVYLDHAAATPLDPRVQVAMLSVQEEQFANPSSLYAAAREARLSLETARREAARVLGAKPTEIVWTSGGTESLNLAISGVLRAAADSSWVTTAIEHPAVLALRLPHERAGRPVVTVPVRPDGIVEPLQVLSAVTDKTSLVSVMLANNEIGTIQPIAAIAAGIEAIRQDRQRRGVERPLYLHTDACGAAGYLDLSVARLHVDLLSINGSKLSGPRGSGLLYVRQGTSIEPLIYGGGQERGRRSGTENVAAAVGLATALTLAQAERSAESRRLAELRDRLLAHLRVSLPELIVNGSLKHRLPNNLNLSLPGLDGETLVLYLDQVGIMASTGSACSSSNAAPSHVLLAIDRHRAETTASLRLTLGRTTTDAAVEYVAERLPKIVDQLRQLN